MRRERASTRSRLLESFYKYQQAFPEHTTPHFSTAFFVLLGPYLQGVYLPTANSGSRQRWGGNVGRWSGVQRPVSRGGVQQHKRNETAGNGTRCKQEIRDSHLGGEGAAADGMMCAETLVGVLGVLR